MSCPKHEHHEKIISCLFLLSVPSFASAQGCLPDGINITTQQQINDFAIAHPGGVEIEGHLRIEEETPGTITNLLGLSVIKRIGGFYRAWKITYPSLAN